MRKPMPEIDGGRLKNWQARNENIIWGYSLMKNQKIVFSDVSLLEKVLEPYKENCYYLQKACVEYEPLNLASEKKGKHDTLCQLRLFQIINQPIATTPALSARFYISK